MIVPSSIQLEAALAEMVGNLRSLKRFGSFGSNR